METAALSPNLAGERSEIGGYRVLRMLSAESWLAEMQGGRKLVLKVLDEDGLWKGQLHPNIRDRLGRVRELAHAGVANLYGVERDGALTYLVWEYVAGETLGERAKSPACGQRDMQVLAREWVLGVEMLHARGIVHGRLSASNAIVDSNGRLTITHVSPLLYSDPDQDVADLIGVLLELLDVREELESPLGRLLERASAEGIPLRRLAARLGALIESRETETLAEPDGAVSRRIRRRAVVGAAATVAVGVAVFWGLREFSDARTPKPPVPPEAAPAALRSPAGERSSNAAAVASPAGGTTGMAWSRRTTAP